MFFVFFFAETNENVYPPTSSTLSSGRVSTCTPSGIHISPESTISSGDHAHFRVPHQVSLDSSYVILLDENFVAIVNVHVLFVFRATGPQTLQDLQQKLAKLTCQPFDIPSRTNVPSQTGTPHQQV